MQSKESLVSHNRFCSSTRRDSYRTSLRQGGSLHNTLQTKRSLFLLIKVSDPLERRLVHAIPIDEFSFDASIRYQSVTFTLPGSFASCHIATLAVSPATNGLAEITSRKRDRKLSSASSPFNASDVRNP